MSALPTSAGNGRRRRRGAEGHVAAAGSPGTERSAGAASETKCTW